MHRHLGVAGGVTDGEGAAFDRLDGNVEPHLLDDVFHGQLSSLLFVEVEVLNDPLEPAPTEDLLTDRSEAIDDGGCHG